LVPSGDALDLFVAVPGHGRYLVRELPRATGPYGLAQTLSVILRTAAGGLRRGEDVGTPAPPPPPPPPIVIDTFESASSTAKPAATAPELPWLALSAWYAIAAYNTDAVSHRGLLGAELAIHRNWRIEATGGLGSSVKRDAGDAALSVSAYLARVGALGLVPVGHLELGGGAFVMGLWQRSHVDLAEGFQETTPGTRFTAAAVAALVARYAFTDHIVGQARLCGELDFNPSRWVIEDRGTRTTVLEPWRFRPALEVGLTIPM
jgi:hypothetical protein